MGTANLTDADKAALSALIYSKSGAYYWPAARWIGVCTRGHVIVSGSVYKAHCTEVVVLPTGQNYPCFEQYHTLPQQDALMAAFKLGGWEALVQAATDMIGLSEGDIP